MNFLDKIGTDNTLWHFGDSFSLWGNDEHPDKEAKKGYSEYIAEHYNLNFRHYGNGGDCNEQIFKELIINFPKFKKGDLVLINWSFFERISYITKNLNFFSSVILNNFSHEVHKEYTPYNDEYFNYFLNNKTIFSTLESLSIFHNTIIPFIQSIEIMGVSVINSFNSFNVSFEEKILNSHEFIKYRSPKDSFVDDSLLIQDRIKVIKWEDTEYTDYLQFLNIHGYYGEGEDVHYKFGIQEELARHWIDRIDNQIL